MGERCFEGFTGGLYSTGEDLDVGQSMAEGPR